jgi:S-adenosylmethionine-diacylgycerolhomoserine-N-methlytransferase
MSGAGSSQSKPGGSSAIERYYKLHSRIYDATRWSFLFGRTTIIDIIAQGSKPTNILEVGCGTGKNLVNLAQRFPDAKVTGVDLSEVMLGVARGKMESFGERVQLLHRCYDRPLHETPEYDLVLFSYALTMFNPGWDTAIEAAKADIKQGGHIAVVDFHNSAFPPFKRWMGVNHVRMDGHLMPALEAGFAAETSLIKNAYAGLWKYCLFLGRKQ